MVSHVLFEKINVTYTNIDNMMLHYTIHIACYKQSEVMFQKLPHIKGLDTNSTAREKYVVETAMLHRTLNQTSYMSQKFRVNKNAPNDIKEEGLPSSISS